MTKSHELPDDQGALFGVEFHGNGATDPADYQVHAELTPMPDGTFPEAEEPAEAESVLGDDEVLDALRQEAATRRRSAAQMGKHSPLQRAGTYEAVRSGDVLPGFGVVTNRNLPEAQGHARTLEVQRKR